MRRLCLIAALLYPLAAAAEPKKLAVLDLEQLQGLQLDARAFTARLQNVARKALPGRRARAYLAAKSEGAAAQGSGQIARGLPG
jgi:hypothetical protein